jgi:alanyl-tRNA synthetase
LKQGVVIFSEATATAEKAPQRVIPGEVAFKLYDTYGFPTDLTADMARERGLSVDMAGFERAMTEQRERARAASKFAADHGTGVTIDQKTIFTGYDALVGRGRVVALIKGKHRVDFLTPGEEGVVVLDRTPFYAEGGGQVGDAGVLRAPNLEFAVSDTQRYGKAMGTSGMHMGSRELRVGDELEAVVDRGAPAGDRSSTTPRRTSCTRRCAPSSASTSSRRAHWSRPTGCASTSRTTSR